VDLEFQRLGDLVGEVAGQVAAGGVEATDQGIAEPAEGHRVVSAARARLPGRRLRGEGVLDAAGVAGVLEAEVARQGRQADAVVEDVGDSRGLLAAGRELRPPARNRLVEGTAGATEGVQQRECRRALDRREREDRGVGIGADRAVEEGRLSPPRRARGTALAAGATVLVEGPGGRGEGGTGAQSHPHNDDSSRRDRRPRPPSLPIAVGAASRMTIIHP